MLSEYLRELATRCLHWSRDCFDLRAAERLRLMAGDLTDQANALEQNADRGSMPLAGITAPVSYEVKPEPDG